MIEMEFVQIITDDVLPVKYKNIIIKEEDGLYEIRSNLYKIEDIIAWIQDFGKNTNTKWIVNKTFPKGERMVCKRFYDCQHSNTNKAAILPNNKNKKGVSKNLKCESKIVFKIKLSTKATRKRDSYVRDGLPCIITLCTSHNHPLSSYEVLKYLPATEETKKQFHDYFEAGMGVQESRSHHCDLLDLMQCSEEDYINGSINPSYRTVLYWYENYQNEKFGSKLNADIDELLNEKEALFKAKGIIISYNKNPFCITIVTPLMQRAHKIPEAKNTIFIDSMSCCDAGNHIITLLLTASSAGAIPLGILLTKDQKTETFVIGFSTLTNSVEDSFYKQNFPKIVITDDCASKINAVKKVWPNVEHFLSIFHVLQYVWRWLHDLKNCIPQNIQKNLFTNFQMILFCTNEEDAANAYEVALELGQNYKEWAKYLNHQWAIKEKWCLAYRINLVEHHTNNYAEIRNVLGRIKTYNIMAMIEFICSKMEVFYQQKLQDFADGKNSKQRLLLQKMLRKCSYLQETDIEMVSEFEFSVPSEKNPTSKYLVNALDGFCECEAGKVGKFCKHLAAVFKFYKVTTFDKLPPVSSQSCRLMVFVAFGENVKAEAFLTLHVNHDVIQNEAIFQEIVENNDVCSSEYDGNNLEDVYKNNRNVNPESENDPDTASSIQILVNSSDVDLDLSNIPTTFINILKQQCTLQRRFGSSEDGLKKFSQRLEKLNTVGQWETFIHTAANPISLRHSSKSKIKLQSTFFQRRCNKNKK